MEGAPRCAHQPNYNTPMSTWNAACHTLLACKRSWHPHSLSYSTHPLANLFHVSQRNIGCNRGGSSCGGSRRSPTGGLAHAREPAGQRHPIIINSSGSRGGGCSSCSRGRDGGAPGSTDPGSSIWGGIVHATSRGRGGGAWWSLTRGCCRDGRARRDPRHHLHLAALKAPFSFIPCSSSSSSTLGRGRGSSGCCTRVRARRSLHRGG